MNRAVSAARGVVQLFALGLTAYGAAAVAATTERISIGIGGAEPNGDSAAWSISDDGRYVAFVSAASNLVPNDTNGAADVFLFDRTTRVTSRISVGSGGVQANGESGAPHMSGDGRYVAFHSFASNLVPGDTNAAADAFVHDRATGVTTRVSVASNGTQGVIPSYGTFAGSLPKISKDGRFVVFWTQSTNLAAGQVANGSGDLLLHDRSTGSTTIVSISTGGARATWGVSGAPVMSRDGRFVSFVSVSTNLVVGDTNGASDVFLRDRQASTTQLISLNTTGHQANGDSYGVEGISDDGRYFVFWSGATNLVANDTNGVHEAFVRDRVAGTTERVCVGEGGVQVSASCSSVGLSADGRFALIYTAAANLVAGDTNGVGDFFVFDRDTKRMERVSVGDAGVQGNAVVGNADLSADGRFVVFSSSATNLTAGGTNGAENVFIRDRGAILPPQGPLDPQIRPVPGVSGPIEAVGPEPALADSINAVKVVHGWGSAPEVWANETVSNIKIAIRNAYDSGILSKTERWEVSAFDWSSAAGHLCGICPPGILTWTAYSNGVDQGNLLGNQLVSGQYDRIHFIAHSAGSAVVDSAANLIRLKSAKQPFIHTTFLDSYHPFPDSSPYGTASNWAEQFVDKRDSLTGVVGWGTLENTNLVLPKAFNFDVTSLDDRSGIWNILQAHEWPHVWYRRTTLAPLLWRYGWGASLEHDPGRVPLHTQFARGDECKLVSVNTNCSEVSSVIRDLVLFPVSGLFDPWTSAPNVTVTPSPTGVVYLGSAGRIDLTVGSPAWVQLTSNVGVEIDSMRFSYQFSSGTDGLLSVFLDDQLVFRADQANAEDGVNLSGIVPLGAVPMGPHTITFRLDHYGTSKPKVAISGISYGSSRFVDRTNTPPVANAGSPKEVPVGSTVRLDGSASRDADGGPLPLVFRWRQVSGPSARLIEPASSSPSFIASRVGTYVLELVVHDGHEWSAPSTVSIAAIQSTLILNPGEELGAFDPQGILRWAAAGGADAYEVWAYRDAGLTQLAEFSKALTSREYQFTQLAGGQTYYIKMYYRVGGVWQEMPAFTLTTTTSVTKSRLLNSQEELEAFGPSGTLRWTAVAGADVYELWIYRDAQRVAFAETSGPVRITQYRISSLTPGKTYYVQVYARVNGQYTAGEALPLTVTAQQNRARVLNPQEELDAFDPKGILRWSPVTGATAYELWIFTDPNSANFYEASGSLSERNYATRTLQPGQAYYAQAYSLVNGQWQVGSPVKITTTGQVTKARLTNAQAELESFSSTGTLRWTAVPGATAYELWIYGNAGLGSIIESGANADRSYTVKRLCAAATYYVQVFAQLNGQWTMGWPTRLDVAEGTAAADCVPPAPVITLTADSVEVLSGENVTLRWSSKFATQCTASGAWSGAKALSGQETVGPITKSSLFTLTCTGQSGSYKAETLVTVATSKLGKVVVTRGVEKTSSGRSGGGAADGWWLLGLGALGCAARRRRATVDR